MDLDFTILKKLRKLKKVTLKKLSDVTGVSVQALTKLENNKTNPTIYTLKSICNFFNIDVTSLIQWAEIGHPKKFNSEFLIENEYISSNTLKINNLILSIVNMKQGGKSIKTINHTIAYEICQVISGKICVYINKERYELNKSEALYLDCIYEHYYEALEESQFLVIVFPKQAQELIRLKNPFNIRELKF